MTKETKSFILLSAAFVSAAALFLFRPPSPPPTALIEPRLIRLREPFQHVTAAFYADGGSIGILIRDADGQTEQFAIPVRPSGARYQEVFVGAKHITKPGATRVAHPEETKQALIVILSRYSHGDPHLDFATMELSRRPADFLKVLIHRVAGDYERRP